MSNEIIIALISFLGTFIGTIGGIIASSKLTTYRIAQLEEKVSKHNGLIDRMYKIETRVTVLEENYIEHLKGK